MEVSGLTAPSPYTLPTESMIGGETKTIRITGNYAPSSFSAQLVLLNYVSRSNTPVISKQMTVEDGEIHATLAMADTRTLYGKFIYQITVVGADGSIDVMQGIMYIYRNAANDTYQPQATDTYHIQYVSAHGTAPSAKDVYVWSGSSYTLTAADLPTLSADGYQFNGWNYNIGDTISADTVITASWTEITYVTITLHYVSAHGTAPADQLRSYPTGGSYTLTAADLPVLSAEGYIFGGWDHSAGEQIIADLTVTASWTADTRESVYYGIGTPVNRNDMPNFANLSSGVYTAGTAFSFTTNTGSGQYSYFAYPISLGTAGFRYMFPDEGSWWSGGYSSLGTTSYGGVVYAVYRSTNANLGQMTTAVTIS